MLLRSLPRAGSYPSSDACPTSCRPRGATVQPPASAPICHREMLPPLAFFAALRAATSPAGCSSADSASARAETHSSTASLRSRPAPAPRHPPTSSLSASRLLARPSAVPPRDLPVRESPSASLPLLSPCSSAPPSTRCDKNAPRTAATALPDKIHRGFPPAPNTCRKRIAARLSVHALSGAAEMPSNSPCLPSSLPLLPALRENPLHSRQSPPAATRCALRRPNSASATSRPDTHTGGGLRSVGSGSAR